MYNIYIYIYVYRDESLERFRVKRCKDALLFLSAEIISVSRT